MNTNTNIDNTHALTHMNISFKINIHILINNKIKITQTLKIITYEQYK